MGRRKLTAAVGTVLESHGQPRGAEGPPDVDLDGSRLGGVQEFRYATGGEPVRGDWGLEMLRSGNAGRKRRG